jgi:L-ascorbate metabolism protein UlaG (beta-lactamase superfamily)
MRLPGLTLGPKRLTAPALTVRDLPKIDIVLLSHAHFDHFDMRTLHRFHRLITVITAHRANDLLRWTRFRDVSELRWKERKSVSTSTGKIDITAFRVKHWGARKQRDIYRGYNSYVPHPFFWRHRAERFVCGAARFRSLRFGDHVDRRLQSLDSFALHSGTSRANGQ